MARINLLPWRQEERDRKNKEFIAVVVAVIILTAALAGAVWYYFDTELNSQRNANDKISQENTRLDTVLTEIDSLEQRREDMISRMRVVQGLQGHRPIPVHVWDDLARAIPNSVYLTNIRREGDILTISGRASNPNFVSDLLRNLDASVWMGQSTMRTISNDTTRSGNASNDTPESKYVQFEINTVIQSDPIKEDDKTSEDEEHQDVDGENIDNQNLEDQNVDSQNADNHIDTQESDVQNSENTTGGAE